MTDYQLTPIYKKIPKSAKDILNRYAANHDTAELFSAITDHVQTYPKATTRYIRTSEFRSILSKYFNLTKEALKPIEQTKQQTIEYNAVLNESKDKRTECFITKELFNNIVNASVITELLVRSGLRVQELLQHTKIRDNKAYVKLSKHRTDPNLDKASKATIEVPVNILGDTDDWITKFNNINKDGTTPESIAKFVNKMLKNIIPADCQKRSLHICRAIYARYHYQFLNPTNRQFHQVTKEVLNHLNDISSNSYAYVILDPAIRGTYSTNKYDRGDLERLKSRELASIMKAESIKNRSNIKTKEQRMLEILKIQK